MKYLLGLYIQEVWLHSLQVIHIIHLFYVWIKHCCSFVVAVVVIVRWQFVMFLLVMFVVWIPRLFWSNDKVLLVSAAMAEIFKFLQNLEHVCIGTTPIFICRFFCQVLVIWKVVLLRYFLLENCKFVPWQLQEILNFNFIIVTEESFIFFMWH